VRLELVPMTQAEFEDYMDQGAVQHLANELARARDLSAETALKMALQSFDGIHPERKVDSPDQFVFHVADGATRIGVLHFGIKRDRTRPYVYVWDIVIRPEYRGNGYGEGTMRALERKTSELGFSRIALNVFGHNAPAVALYNKLGYRPASMAMVKELE
jgi:ribosomal protein S18 acetylase RimI-like enzyme